MIPAIKAEFDQDSIVGVNQVLSAMVRDLGMDAKKTMGMYARSMVRQLIDLTPPSSKLTAGGSSQKIGRNAVEKDIRRAVTLIKYENFSKSPTIRKAIKDQNYKAVEAIAKNWPSLKGKKIVPFDPTLHTSKRVGYKVPKKTDTVFTLDKEKYNRYLKEVFEHVGKLKSIWVNVANSLGVRSAGWVSKHAGFGNQITSFKNTIETDNSVKELMIRTKIPDNRQIGGIISWVIEDTGTRMLRDYETKLAWRLRQITK